MCAFVTESSCTLTNYLLARSFFAPDMSCKVGDGDGGRMGRRAGGKCSVWLGQEIASEKEYLISKYNISKIGKE